MKSKILVLGIIFLMMLDSVLSAEKKKEVNSWQEFFTEPVEQVYIIMKDGTIFRHTSHDETKVHMNIGMLEKWLKEFKNKNYSIKDIATVIHNHLKGCGFSPGDHKQYNRLKEHGFNGRFLLYCQRTGKTYNVEKKEVRE